MWITCFPGNLYNIHEWKVVCAVMNAEELWGSACRILQEEMEHVVHYNVPLTTEVGTGKTWLEAH